MYNIFKKIYIKTIIIISLFSSPEQQNTFLFYFHVVNRDFY